MGNAYYEVLRTYWRRATSSLFVGVCVFPQLLLAVGLFGFRKIRDEHLMLIAMVVGFIGGLMWVHFREQIVDERRRFWPGFLAPHLLIFGILLTLLTIVWPGALILSSGSQSVALMTFAALLMAFIGLWVLNPLPHLIIVGVIGMGLFMTGIDSPLFQSFLYGRHEPLALALLGGSLLVIGLTIVRMTRLTEADPAYHRRLHYSQSSLRPRMTGEVSQAWVEAKSNYQFGWPRDGKFYVPRDTGLWDGARRWLSLNRGASWFFLIFSVAIVANAEFIRHAWMTSEPSPIPPMLAICLPVAMVGGSWMQLWRFLEFEMLRPIDRASFFKQIGLAMAINVLQAWGITALVIVVDAMIFGSLGTGWGKLLSMLGVSLALQLVGFGAWVWLMRFRSQVLPMASIAVVLMPSFFLMPMVYSGISINRPVLLIATLVLGAIGIVVIRDAYHRWLVTEIGA